MKWDDSDMENAFDEGCRQEVDREEGDWVDFDGWFNSYKRRHDPIPDDDLSVRPDVIKYDEQVLEYRMMIRLIIRTLDGHPDTPQLFVLTQSAMDLLNKYPSQPDKL